MIFTYKNYEINIQAIHIHGDTYYTQYTNMHIHFLIDLAHTNINMSQGLKYTDNFIYNLYSIYCYFFHTQHICSRIIFVLQNCTIKLQVLVGRK